MPNFGYLSTTPPPDVLSSLAEGIKTAIPFYRNGTITANINLNNYDEYFSALHTSQVSYVHPNTDTDLPDFISESDFVLVCKYFLKLRLDNVYSRALGKFVNFRATLPTVHVPVSLVKVLQSIGVVSIFNSNVTVVPKGEELPEDYFSALHVSPDIFESFNRLITSFPNKSSSPFTDSVYGKPFWLLSVRENGNQSVIAREKHSVVVLSSFPDFSPEDAALASIVQNGFDGVLEDYPIVYRSSSINNALLLRQRFHLDAKV